MPRGMFNEAYILSARWRASLSHVFFFGDGGFKSMDDIRDIRISLSLGSNRQACEDEGGDYSGILSELIYRHLGANERNTVGKKVKRALRPTL